ERSLCQDRFDSACWLPRLAAIIQCAFDEKVQRREQNFIGKMLRHHQHRSTEFMSRWIEHKNKSHKR
ncbi:MAG: group 1 glycosyl transferase, partial [Verrucomicrobiota bacterium]|nr:group 1 glycosyl transferase [Verrucomicrobiota bacterium]